jgi:hypothetical protein
MPREVLCDDLGMPTSGDQLQPMTAVGGAEVQERTILMFVVTAAVSDHWAIVQQERPQSGKHNLIRTDDFQRQMPMPFS